ncbi:hypothetical protein LXL04_024843 [Taraxacum kok-saghyz]
MLQQLPAAAAGRRHSPPTATTAHTKVVAVKVKRERLKKSKLDNNFRTEVRTVQMRTIIEFENGGTNLGVVPCVKSKAPGSSVEPAAKAKPIAAGHIHLLLRRCSAIRQELDYDWRHARLAESGGEEKEPVTSPEIMGDPVVALVTPTVAAMVGGPIQRRSPLSSDSAKEGKGA